MANPIATDQFNRGTAALGANWTAVTGLTAPTLVNSKAEPAGAANNNSAANYSGSAAPNDQYGQITLGPVLNANSFSGINVRSSASANTRYEFLAKGPYGSTAELILVKIIAGVQSALTTYTVGLEVLTNQTVNAGDSLVLAAIGTTIYCFQNGTLVIQATDASIASGLAGMILQWNIATTDATISYFAMGAAQSSVVAIPVISPSSGTSSLAQTITITSATSGAVIYYTTDGSVPTESSLSIVNGGTITIPAGLAAETVRAIGAKASMIDSAFASAYFNADQWAQATITAVAPYTATLSITAAVVSGGNVTYTYTVTQGNAALPISGGTLYVIISSMQHSGNNGTFAATTFGSGTFTVANASGVNESGSTGVGICPSDSGCGVTVRATTDGMNGYVFHIGTNSFSGDGRTAFREFWKLVGGGIGLQIVSNVGSVQTTLPVIGDTVAILAEGSVITAFYKGLVYVDPNGLVYSASDTSLGAGNQGVNAWSLAGLDEYNWSKWAAGTLASNTPGNNGTQANNFLAGYLLKTKTSDSFVYSNGDLATKNPLWVYTAGSFNINTDTCYSSSAGSYAAYRSDAAPNADQYSEGTMVITVAAATQNCGPAVRISASANTYYCIQAATATLGICRSLAGVFSTLASSTAYAITGDVLRLTVKGTVLTLWKNGVAIVSVSDSSIASGGVGIFGAGNANSNGFSAWDGGSWQWFQTESDTFARANGVLGSQWQGPYSTTMESCVSLLSGGINIINNGYASLSGAGGDAYAVFNSQNSGGGGAVGWSPVDSRQAVPGFGPAANTGIVDAQGNEIFSAQNPPFTGNSQTSDNSAIPPMDSRAVKPTDCRVSTPVNSRVAPPFGGPGEP